MSASLDAAILANPGAAMPGARGDDGATSFTPRVLEAPTARADVARVDAAVGADGIARDADAIDVVRNGVVTTVMRDELAALLATDAVHDFRTGEHTVLRARCDDIVRRVIRDGGDVSYASLARELATSPATVKKLMATAVYRETYSRVSDETYGTIDDAIVDERRDVLTRGDALQRRALTLLGEAMEISRAHIAAVRGNPSAARSSLIQAGIDAAAEVRQVVTSRAAATSNGATINVTVNRQQAVVIRGALVESGVDLSDILGDVFGAPATHAPTAPAASSEAA